MVATLDRPRADDDTVPVQQVRVPSRQVIPGALSAQYDIPQVEFRRRWAVTVTITIGLLVASALWRLRNGVVDAPLFLLWIAPLLAFRAFGWVLSCLDKPARVSPEQQEMLDELFVTVSIPCLNEDTGILDRALWSLANQTRRPQRIDLVVDGLDRNKIDYAFLEEYWTAPGRIPGCYVEWTYKEFNDGKRRAHFTTFSRDSKADIEITLDSDTAPALNGVAEILKPFADPEVMSVAGIEFGMNANENFLTILQNALQQIAQCVVAAAWSVTGDMFTNRGPFAAYRATMLREILPLYANETFYGHRIILGDDSLLALAGSMRGRSVQQLSAFGLTMWPDNLGWHLRQRLRWARGRTIRNFWRFKYYRFGSYIWWFAMINAYAFFIGVIALGRFILMGTLEAFGYSGTNFIPVLARFAIAMVVLGWLSQLRCLAFKRSDESFMDRALLVIIRPLASIWASVVLTRIIRALGIATCLKQGKPSDWTTRKNGAEITLKVEGEMLHD